jgi:glycosyltransferase involved in cell wall biosynthesis
VQEDGEKIMNDWSPITMVMITRNAAATLTAALRSIPAGAEIIVADADSTDRTVSIARSFGARVIRQDPEPVAAAGGNFDLARNQAMDQAGRNWLFILDSDEQLSPALAEEIAVTVRTDRDHTAYDMPRRNLFWGKAVRLLGEDRQIRLLRRGRGRYMGNRLHRPIRIDGPVGRLREPLIHHNITGLRDVSRRFRRYLPIERQNVDPAASRLTALRLAGRMGRYYLIRQQAWRDGWRGVLASCIFSLYHGLAQWPGKK